MHEQLLYTTLRIECFDAGGSLKAFGTGFLLERKVSETASKIFLVSNKHVLLGYESIALTFTAASQGNPQHGTKRRFFINELQKYVKQHPSDAIDIAVIDCTGVFVANLGQIYYKFVSYEMLSDFTDPELTVAQNVYFVGYPDNVFDVVNNLPLIRSGLIASHPSLDYNGTPVFIIDAQVFPGSSGSPVYIDLTYENFKNGNIMLGESKKLKLLGIVSATMLHNNKLVAVQTPAINICSQEVLGLGIVYKATAIKELINSLVE
jgi:hypothetical protein